MQRSSARDLGAERRRFIRIRTVHTVSSLDVRGSALRITATGPISADTAPEDLRELLLGELLGKTPGQNPSWRPLLHVLLPRAIVLKLTQETT